MFSLNMLDSSLFFLLLSTCFVCAEQVKGVILSYFYSLGFIIRDFLHDLKLWVVVETAQSKKSSFPFLFDLGLGTLTQACQKLKCYLTLFLSSVPM